MTQNYKQEVCGFEFVASQELPDYGVTALLYKHKKHGCQFLYLKTDDSHNFFSETFRTAPLDDRGRSHMLEHLVLDGTEKYPVNDLFTELDKRSFSTYMNAMTSNQYTSFPFSTINKQDYFNILDVYLDSCFHPRLSPIDFMSECFHVEFEDNDPSKPLINSGVVYNEMRGYFNSAITRAYYAIRKELLPDSSEHFESGGLPEEIANSTINDIKEHHSKYYHPSNAMFFHYGNIPIEEVFDKVNQVISEFPVSDWKLDKSVFNQPRWTEQKRVVIDGSFDPMTQDKTKQYKVNVVYMTAPWENYDDVNDIDFLTDLITRSDSSPMYKAILKPGLAVKTFLNGFHNDCYNTFVNFGYEGISENDVDKVIGLIQETLEKCFKDGFDKDRVEALIHENEMEARKLTSNQGLSLFSRIASSTCYGIDPFKMLDTSVYINRIRANLAKNPRYYEDLMKTVFFDNKHRLTLIIKPVEGYLDNITKGITESLAEQKKKLTEEEIQTIVKNYNILKENQEKPQPLEKLPSIKRADLSRVGEIERLTSFDDNVAVMAIPMNQMTYVNITIKVDFEHPLLEYIPLLSLVIDSIGAGDMDEEQLDIYMSLHCKRVCVVLNTKTDLEDPENVSLLFRVFTSCLDRNIETMMKILKMILFEPHLNNVERIKTLIKRHLTNCVKMAQSRGDYVVAKYLGAGVNRTGALNEVISGLKHISFLNSLIAKDDWNDVCDKLQTVYKECFLRGYAKGIVHTTSTDCVAINMLKEIVNQLNDHEVVPQSPLIDKSVFEDHQNSFIETETSTSFTLSVCNSTPYLDEKSPLFNIITEILSNEFLHQAVRVKIGAYGVWANNNPEYGIFSMVSFRDPNVTAVLEAYEKAVEECTSGEITDEMVDRAVVKCFSIFDAPKPPHLKGMNEFNGKTPEIIQKRREIVFNATKKQIEDITKFLKEQKWRRGTLSSKSIAPPPEGFKVISFS